jgi:ribonuclease P protein subunit POP4
MQKASNIIKHELIGLKAEITKSTNKNQIGITGEIVDETKNLLIIKTQDGLRQIAKEQATFKLGLPKNETVEVDGKLLVGRPESRIKKHIPKTRV